eukprot:TRINITY_DN15345_c0_g1_i1.p2 TRINITY_DN15345_c0_g1~~TRINITY_DN15345_c0_g1_i1.p2  ORF type:complete len:143 (-),score=21.85 TRINITY_DN15345_c0_g1_i1:360-788(-)
MEGYPKQITIDESTIITRVFHKAPLESYGSTIDQLREKNIGFLLCFSVDSMESLEALKPVAKQLREESAPMVIVGCKGDLGDEKKVADASAEQFASEMGATYVLTSASNGSGVDQAFRELLNVLIKRAAQSQKPHSRRCHIQ